MISWRLLTTSHLSIEFTEFDRKNWKKQFLFHMLRHLRIWSHISTIRSFILLSAGDFNEFFCSNFFVRVSLHRCRSSSGHVTLYSAERPGRSVSPRWTKFYVTRFLCQIPPKISASTTCHFMSKKWTGFTTVTVRIFHETSRHVTWIFTEIS